MKLPRLHAFALSLIAGLTLGCTSVGFSQEVVAEDPFIPFSKPGDLDGELPAGPKAPGRTSARISDDTEPAEGSGFRWPSIPKPRLPSLPKLSLPSWTTEQEMPRERMRQPEEPSTWSKFTGGTKDLFSKTKQTLMPWTQDDEETTVRRPAPPRRSPSKTPNRTKGRPAPTEKKSFFSWLSPKQEQQPATVNEFLAQPRLK